MVDLPTANAVSSLKNQGIQKEKIKKYVEQYGKDKL
jgi:hypothetical protein